MNGPALILAGLAAFAAGFAVRAWLGNLLGDAPRQFDDDAVDEQPEFLGPDVKAGLIAINHGEGE